MLDRSPITCKQRLDMTIVVDWGIKQEIITKGEDCEEDYDGCLPEPCALGQTCTDMNTTFHQQSGTAHECSACPEGFELNDNKCQGKVNSLILSY